jgi:hypothetical protein
MGPSSGPPRQRREGVLDGRKHDGMLDRVGRTDPHHSCHQRTCAQYHQKPRSRSTPRWTRPSAWCLRGKSMVTITVRALEPPGSTTLPVAGARCRSRHWGSHTLRCRVIRSSLLPSGRGRRPTREAFSRRPATGRVRGKRDKRSRLGGGKGVGMCTSGTNLWLSRSIARPWPPSWRCAMTL